MGGLGDYDKWKPPRLLYGGESQEEAFHWCCIGTKSSFLCVGRNITIEASVWGARDPS